MEFENSLHQNHTHIDSTSMMTGMSRQTMNILCCMCGISFNPQETKTNICIRCLSNKTDITEGITKQGVLNFCRMCRRYARPQWVYMERESKDLLSLCLKKISGLNQVKLLDAQFMWTEPHSRRIKIKLTIQKEVINNASLQHTFEVEFVEHYMQCDDCKKEFTPHTWVAIVQVRQRVQHKRTFYYLEQLILKNNAHSQLIKIEEKDDGLDFFYKNKQHAQRLVDYLQTILPMKIKPSKQLVSYDEQNDIFHTKYSWSAEIPRVCKDDLVIIPPKLCKELGGVCPLLLCLKLSNTIRCLETKTMKRIELNPERYFHYEKDIQIITLKNNKSEFMIQDCEKQHDTNLNESYQTSVSNLFINKIYNLEVTRTSDWQMFQVKTHLGSAIKEGATLEGFDLTKINFEEIDNLKGIPEVIMVKRIYDKNRRKNRIWKLNRIDNEGVMVEEEGIAEGIRKKKSKNDKTNQEDFEDFMDDIEVNPEMQKHIRMYKDEEKIKKLTQKQIERRTKKNKQKERKVVVVTNVRKQQDTNIFNKPEEIPEVNEDEEEQKQQELNKSKQDVQQQQFKEPKTRNNRNKKQRKQDRQELQKKQEKDLADEQEDSDYEDDEVKIHQLEEWFENVGIQSDNEDDNKEQNNEEAIDNFIKEMDNIKLSGKKI